MIELIGIFLLAGTVTSVAVINAVHRPYEKRSNNPHDFELTAVDAYHRLINAAAAGEINGHFMRVTETVDPLYFIARLNFRDDIGNTCEALVTFDIVEGYKSTTTVRWSCKFLKWCERQTADAVESQLDQWIETSLGKDKSLQVDLAAAEENNRVKVAQVTTQAQGAKTQTQGALTQAQEATNCAQRATTQAQEAQEAPGQLEEETAKGMSPASMSQNLKKKLRKPPSTISPAPLQFPTSVEDAYRRIKMRLGGDAAASASGTSNGATMVKPHKGWIIVDEINDAYIVADLAYFSPQSKQSVNTRVNFDFSRLAEELAVITWSCEFKEWCNETTIREIESFIHKSLKEILSKTELATPFDQLNSITRPVKSLLRSTYPKQFAYLKVMQRIKSAPDKRLNWKLIECMDGQRIVALLAYRAQQTSNIACSAEFTMHFETDATSTIIECVYRFSADADIAAAQILQDLNDRWIESALR